MGPRRKLLLIAAVVAAPLFCGGAASGQTSESRFIVSYVEAPAGGEAALDRSVQAYAQQMRHAPGSPAVEVLHEIGRSGRMVIVERWPGSVTEPDTAGEALGQAVEGEVEAPVDRRLGRPLGLLLTGSAAAPFHMVMHVDVAPDGSAQGAKALQDQRALIMAAPGGLGFEIGVQSDKPNHFAVHETWASRAAYQAYMAGPGGRDLRRRLMEFRGAPFDDRFYVSGPTGK